VSQIQTTPGADILVFKRPNDRFTMADRLALARMEKQNHGVRLAIHSCHDENPPGIAEFASIYPVNGQWAKWGAVRRGKAISVWRARDGRDIGHFATMHEALEAVTRWA
jgi:hypothetical protein